jgi:serine/threonine protein kinase
MAAIIVRCVDPPAVRSTDSHMSPEHAQDSCVYGRSDMFSLGVVLDEMLTGLILRPRVISLGARFAKQLHDCEHVTSAISEPRDMEALAHLGLSRLTHLPAPQSARREDGGEDRGHAEREEREDPEKVESRDVMVNVTLCFTGMSPC